MHGPFVRADSLALKTSPKMSKKLKILQSAVFMCVGAVLVAVGLEIFLVPNNIIDGGITGISIILSHLTGFRLGLFLFVLNVPFLIVGYQQIGKTFALSTLFSIIILSIVASMLVPVPGITNDPLASRCVWRHYRRNRCWSDHSERNGGLSDGTEVVAVLVNKKLPWSVGQVVMFFNIFILGSAGFVFGWNHAMYSLIAYFIAFKTIDVTIDGFDETKAIWVISDKYRDLGEAILHRLGRGVTYMNAEGAFTGDDKKVIFCVISRLEEAKLKSIVEHIDPDAFLAIGAMAEVRGGRFKKRKIY